MSLAFFVTARMGSTRLPSKHFLEIAGRSVMSQLLERVESAAASDDLIVITTGLKAANHAFDIFESPPRTTVFFGDDVHIPRRHAQAAASLGASAIVAVDGDDPLISIEAMKNVAHALRQGAALAKTVGLPLGMNAWGYSAELLYSVVQTCQRRQLDTGWGRIFDGHEPVVTYHSLPQADSVRMTLDYPEDLEFFRRVFEGCPSAIRNSDAELLRWILDHDVHSINRHLNDVYWKNFKNAE
jgi:spore coat polysaccharide biosynthesis protein SpsF (cytidylyltransferase family)